MNDKVAIVTGAAGNGMGRSIALTLARDGACVVVNYRAREPEAAALLGSEAGRFVSASVLPLPSTPT